MEWSWLTAIGDEFRVEWVAVKVVIRMEWSRLVLEKRAEGDERREDGRGKRPDRGKGTPKESGQTSYSKTEAETHAGCAFSGYFPHLLRVVRVYAVPGHHHRKRSSSLIRG